MLINQTKLSLTPGDIVRQHTDAIVNAANPGLMGGGGVDGAIHKAAGPSVLEECRQIIYSQGRLATGETVITGGGKLKAKYVVHTVGPIWHGGGHGEAELLASAYRKSLMLATEHKLTSISFPSISTGAYGYPVQEAAEVAINATTFFLQKQSISLKKVVFVLFGPETLQAFCHVFEDIL